MAGRFSRSLFFFFLCAIVQIYATQVSAPISVNVQGAAKDAVPILLQTQDYEGPYDPLDPRGEAASRHRAAVVNGKNRLDKVESFFPPGAVDMLVKDLKKVLTKEGKRFALTHPIETTELAGIVMKLMAFINTASHKVKSEGRKELIAGHTHKG